MLQIMFYLDQYVAMISALNKPYEYAANIIFLY